MAAGAVMPEPPAAPRHGAGLPRHRPHCAGHTCGPRPGLALARPQGTVWCLRLGHVPQLPCLGSRNTVQGRLRAATASAPTPSIPQAAVVWRGARSAAPSDRATPDVEQRLRSCSMWLSEVTRPARAPQSCRTAAVPLLAAAQRVSSRVHSSHRTVTLDLHSVPGAPHVKHCRKHLEVRGQKHRWKTDCQSLPRF